MRWCPTWRWALLKLSHDCCCKFQISSLTNSGSENLRVSPYVVTPTQTRRSNRGENARTELVPYPPHVLSRRSVSLPPSPSLSVCLCAACGAAVCGHEA